MNKKKNTLMISTFAKATVIMLLLGSFIPALAYAATPGEQYQTVQEQYQLSKKQILDAQKPYQDSKEKFLNAKACLEDSRTSSTILDMKIATKDFLIKSIDYNILHLEVLESRALMTESGDYAPFKFSDNIEDYKTQLEDLKDDVEAAETRDEFQSVIAEMKDIWQHVNFESRYFILCTANNKVDSFLIRGESVSDRIEAEIERLSSEGADTEKLRQLLNEYNQALQETKYSHEKVNDCLSTHNGFDDNGVYLGDADQAGKFLDEADSHIKHQQLKDGTTVLRKIFTELKHHRQGSADLSGTGKLTASGNGKATMSGKMDLEVSAKSGVLSITDYDGNATVDITGYRTREDLGNGAVRYSGFAGTANISGSCVTVVINGDDIDLTAKGTGSAVLKGHGSFNVEKDGGYILSNDWAPQVPAKSKTQYQAGYMNQTRIQNDTLSLNQTQAKNMTQLRNHTQDPTQDYTQDFTQDRTQDPTQDNTKDQDQKPDQHTRNKGGS